VEKIASSNARFIQEAIKNRESKDGALIRTLHMNYSLHPMAVDDRQIVCLAVGGIRIFEFDSQ
jgi:hypothetical protein